MTPNQSVRAWHKLGNSVLQGDCSFKPTSGHHGNRQTYASEPGVTRANYDQFRVVGHGLDIVNSMSAIWRTAS